MKFHRGLLILGLLILGWVVIVGSSREGFQTLVTRTPIAPTDTGGSGYSSGVAAPDVAPALGPITLQFPSTPCRANPVGGSSRIWLCPNETFADRLIEFVNQVDTENKARGEANVTVAGGSKPSKRFDQVCIQEYSDSSRFFCKNMNLIKGQPDARNSLFQSSGKACDALISGFAQLAEPGVQVDSLKTLTTGIKSSLDNALSTVNAKLAKNCGPGKSGAAELCTGLQSSAAALQREATTLDTYIQRTIAPPLADAVQANTLVGQAFQSLGCQYSEK
jgi:hypothetical protein